MKLSIHRTIALATALCVFAPLVAQPPVDVKPDPEVKVKLKEYKKFISDRKATKDTEATEIIDALLQKYEDMHPKDKSAFAKGISESLSSKRCKRKPGMDRIYRTTIYALGMAGRNGSKPLAAAFKNKAKFKGKDWINLRAEMLEHLGRTKDPKYIDFLLDVALKEPNDTLMAKAGGALRHFDKTKLAVRRTTVKLLIKKFAQIYDNANQNLDPGVDLTRQTWQNRLAAVSDPWNGTLQKLTRQTDIRGSSDWTRFWNKRRTENWDKPKKTRRRR